MYFFGFFYIFTFMKDKKLLISTIIFFLFITTSSLWEGELGIGIMLLAGILFLSFIILSISLICQIIYTITERFKNRNRNILILIMAILLALTVYRPRGLFDFNELNGKNILRAYNEGVANCTENLYLYENGKFRNTSICFGITTIHGEYKISGDSILFNRGRSNNDYYQFAVYDTTDTYILEVHKFAYARLLLYSTVNDTIPSYELYVIKNQIFPYQSLKAETAE